MHEFLSTLWFTICKRPYVVSFLISYLVIAIKLKGVRFTILFLITGYIIAFVSEYSSINTGFPYGWYFYKYENLLGEWLNNGVPVWDSISYVFMNFSGLCFATLCLNKIHYKPQTKSLILLLAASLAVVMLDVIIDPVAHLGAQWFLGDIYFYPNPGIYFDVPISNFLGWFLVSLVINGFGIYVLKFVRFENKNHYALQLGSLLYLGIMLFGIIIAIYLKQYFLVACDLLIFTTCSALLYFTNKNLRLNNSTQSL